MNAVVVKHLDCGSEITSFESDSDFGLVAEFNMNYRFVDQDTQLDDASFVAQLNPEFIVDAASGSSCCSSGLN